jgi:hypothetical protein
MRDERVGKSPTIPCLYIDPLNSVIHLLSVEIALPMKKPRKCFVITSTGLLSFGNGFGANAKARMLHAVVGSIKPAMATIFSKSPIASKIPAENQSAPPPIFSASHGQAIKRPTVLKPRVQSADYTVAPRFSSPPLFRLDGYQDITLVPPGRPFDFSVPGAVRSGKNDPPFLTNSNFLLGGQKTISTRLPIFLLSFAGKFRH